MQVTIASGSVTIKPSGNTQTWTVKLRCMGQTLRTSLFMWNGRTFFEYHICDFGQEAFLFTVPTRKSTFWESAFLVLERKADLDPKTCQALIDFNVPGNQAMQ